MSAYEFVPLGPAATIDSGLPEYVSGTVDCSGCDDRFVNITGDTMSGRLTAPDITVISQVNTEWLVAGEDSLFQRGLIVGAAHDGGIFSVEIPARFDRPTTFYNQPPVLAVGLTPSGPNDLVDKEYVDAALAAALARVDELEARLAAVESP